MSEHERLHTAVLVAPAKERRRLRRQRRRAEVRLHAEQRKAELAAVRMKAERERGAELRKFLARVADHTDAGCREFCVCNVEKWEPHADDCPIAKALKETE